MSFFSGFFSLKFSVYMLSMFYLSRKIVDGFDFEIAFISSSASKCVGVYDTDCQLYNKLKIEMSHVMRKPVNALCEQQRRRSACASAHSSAPLLFTA